jgi:hypothetical protein
MSSFSYFLLSWVFLLTGSESAMYPSSSSTPLPPSKDPFYIPPTNYELTLPGTVLRIRVAPGNLTSVVGNSSVAYNILYRTTDSHYNPSWAVTTLFVPLPSSPSTQVYEASLLSYQVPYDSPNIDASPSYAVYEGGYTDISLALGRGWYVNMPDYEGPFAAFTVGVRAGHATLDSVRAVLSSGFGLAADARYALWGYSGGALASEWAAELQVQYSPELNFRGAALGGLTPNVSSTIESVTGTTFAGLIPLGLLGMGNEYPQLFKFLLKKLKSTGPYNRTTFLSAKHMTPISTLRRFALQDIYEYFIDGSADLQSSVLQQVINRNGLMGYHGVPQMPLFVYQAIADEIGKIEETDALVSKYCAAGADILYQRNTVGGHSEEAVNGDARAFEWLSRVLDGTYSSTGCMIQNVTL